MSSTAEIFVPGRLCLFGEHSDWAGAYRRENQDIVPGKTIVIGTQQGLHAQIQRLSVPELRITVTTDTGETHSKVFNLSDTPALADLAQQGGFWSYVAGTAYRIATDFHIGGLEINNYRTTLPLKKGLSSSAAICVLVARAFNRTYHLNLSTRGEMQYAYEGERMTPSRCGKMDQALAFGSQPVLMTYDGDILHVQTIQLKQALHLVLVDLRSAKDTVTILAALQAAYPTAETEAHKGLHQLLGPINQQLLHKAVEYLATGHVSALGGLMREAQSQFDMLAGPLCPSQLLAPVLHKVLTYPAIQPLIYGGKGVGSQGDGTAQLLCRDAGSQAEVCHILESQLGVHCLQLTMQPTDRAATGDAAKELIDRVPSSTQMAGESETPVKASPHATPIKLLVTS